MQKIEISSRYRDTEPIVTSRLTVDGSCVFLSPSTWRRYSDRLCYAGADGLVFTALDDGRSLIPFVQ